MNWKPNRSRVIGGLWLLSLTGALAAPADDFKTANRLYDAGQFAAAAAAYERIVPKTASLYYNLGNAWFRQGKLGLSVLNYERARRLAPRDPDILANLRFAQQRLGVDGVNTAPRALQRFWAAVVQSRTAADWRAYELAGLWLAALAVGLCVYFPALRPGFVVVGLVGLAGCALAVVALSSQMIRDRTAPAAVVVVRETAARFAPLPDSTVHFRLTEGTEVVIREDRGPWLSIERADGQQGWAQADALEPVGHL